MERRIFAAAAGAAALSAAQSNSEKLTTAVIGVGGRGSGLLAGILTQPNVAVGALCDIKPDRLDRAATAAGRDNPKTYSDWRAVIDRKDITSVYIATPPHLHAEMAVAALEAGKHVYCEKPIGVTPAQVKAVVAAARRSNKVFTAGQQLRSMKLISDAISKVRAGAIGDILMVKAQRHATSDHPKDSSSADWYFDVDKSGGYLIEQSVHNLDLCNWVIGAAPRRACGFGATRLYKNEPPGRSIFDCGSMVFDYPNGVQLTFTQNVFHARQMPGGGQNVHVFGSKASLDLMYGVTAYPLGGKDAGPPVTLAEKGPDDPHAHTAAFFACVRGQGPNPADITVGATGALTAILGHRAMVEERVVTWTELGVTL